MLINSKIPAVVEHGDRVLAIDVFFRLDIETKSSTARAVADLKRVTDRAGYLFVAPMCASKQTDCPGVFPTVGACDAPLGFPLWPHLGLELFSTYLQQQSSHIL